MHLRGQPEVGRIFYTDTVLGPYCCYVGHHWWAELLLEVSEDDLGKERYCLMWYNNKRRRGRGGIHKRAREYLRSIRGRSVGGEKDTSPKLPELQHDPYGRFMKVAAETKAHHGKKDSSENLEVERVDSGKHHHHHHQKGKVFSFALHGDRYMTGSLRTDGCWLYKRELRRREKERRMQVMQQEYLFRQRDDRYGMGPCGEFHIPPIMFGSSGGSSNTTTATPAARGPSNTPGRPAKVAGGSSSKKFGEVGTPMQKQEEGAQAVLHITPQMDPSSVAAAHLQALIESENKSDKYVAGGNRTWVVCMTGRQKVDEAQLEWDKRCLAAWDHEVDRRKWWDISHQLQQAERSRRVEAEERRRKEFNCYVQHRLEIEDIHLAAVPPDHPMAN
ncbi:hypothetical protein FOZ63_020535, partial [Perkinsus olseni]